MKDNLHQISSENLAVLFEETGITAAPENIHLIEGDAGKIIPQAIQNLSTDTLVMGTVARSGIPGLLIGNKAEKILSEVQCTVLAVKPEGFISPVKIT
jgi:nucleotide-binding universal stress UspA family protein